MSSSGMARGAGANRDAGNADGTEIRLAATLAATVERGKGDRVGCQFAAKLEEVASSGRTQYRPGPFRRQRSSCRQARSSGVLLFGPAMPKSPKRIAARRQ